MKKMNYKISEPVWPNGAKMSKGKLICIGDFDKKPKPNDYLCIYDVQNDELLVYYIHNVYREGIHWIVSVGKTERSDALIDCNRGRRKMNFLYNPHFEIDKGTLKMA